EMPVPEEALPGRDFAIPTASRHFVRGAALRGPHPQGTGTAVVGPGWFWGAERQVGQLAGVHVPAVGHAAGYTPNPAYGAVCTWRTGHNEVVLAVFDPKKVSYEALLKTFWESHTPTQGMRQGNAIGTQYRSGIYVTSDAQRKAAEA